MKTTHSIWGILDGDGPLKGVKFGTSNNAIQIEVSQDTDDGTYPTVASYTRDANALDDEGASHFLNRLTRKKEQVGDLIRWSKDYSRVSMGPQCRS